MAKQVKLLLQKPRVVVVVVVLVIECSSNNNIPDQVWGEPLCVLPCPIYHWVAAMTVNDKIEASNSNSGSGGEGRGRIEGDNR